MNLSQIGRVARFEILSTLRRRSAVFVMFVLPFLTLGVTAGLDWLANSQGGGDAGDVGSSILEQIVSGEEAEAIPSGLVDDTGLLQEMPLLAGQLFITYESADDAVAGLDAGEIGAYYVVPAAYPEEPIAYHAASALNQRSGVERIALYQAFAANLVDDARLRVRLSEPAAFSSVNIAPEAQDDRSDFGSRFVLIIGVAVLFYMTIVGAAGYLLQSLGKEKQNRVMELLLSSLRPGELLAGKIAGLGLIGLLQILVWTIVVMLLFRGDSGILRNFSLPTLGAGEWALVIAYFFGGYLVYASLFAGLGAIAPNPKEGSQYTFILMLPVFIPLWFNNLFSASPNSKGATLLSLFPLSAPVAMPMRVLVIGVPAWQWILGLVLLALTGLGLLWIATRIFHSRALLSGRSLSRAAVREAIFE